jgi:hypothetical protein
MTLNVAFMIEVLCTNVVKAVYTGAPAPWIDRTDRAVHSTHTLVKACAAVIFAHCTRVLPHREPELTCSHPNPSWSPS